MLNQTHIVQGGEEELEWGEVTEEEEQVEGEEEGERSNTVLWILPYLCFVIIVLVAKSCRKRQLTSYVAEWNRFEQLKNFLRTKTSWCSRGNGVKLSFGGVGTKRVCCPVELNMTKYGENLKGTHDLREWLWAVSSEAHMTTSAWQWGIPRAIGSSKSCTKFSLA